MTEDAVFASYLIRAVFDKNISAKFIKTFSGSPLYWKQIADKSQGTGQPNVNGKSLSNLILPLPPLAEQKRIAEKVSALLTEIAALAEDEKELAQLEKEFPRKIKASLLQAAIQGKLSEQLPKDGDARQLLRDIQAEKFRLIKENKIKPAPPLPPIAADEIPFDIPANWCWARLGDIFTVHSGQNLTQKQMTKSGYPVYGGNGITGFHDKKLIDKDSLVIGRVGFYCGSVHKVIQDCWVTDNALIVNFFSNKSICTDFFVYLLNHINLKSLAVATAQPVISGKRIYQKIIPLPPLAEQKRIVARLEELMKEIEF